MATKIINYLLDGEWETDLLVADAYYPPGSDILHPVYIRIAFSPKFSATFNEYLCRIHGVRQKNNTHWYFPMGAFNAIDTFLNAVNDGEVEGKSLE